MKASNWEKGACSDFCKAGMQLPTGRIVYGGKKIDTRGRSNFGRTGEQGKGEVHKGIEAA